MHSISEYFMEINTHYHFLTDCQYAYVPFYCHYLMIYQCKLSMHCLAHKHEANSLTSSFWVCYYFTHDIGWVGVCEGAIKTNEFSKCHPLEHSGSAILLVMSNKDNIITKCVTWKQCVLISWDVLGKYIIYWIRSQAALEIADQ